MTTGKRLDGNGSDGPVLRRSAGYVERFDVRFQQCLLVTILADTDDQRVLPDADEQVAIEQEADSQIDPPGRSALESTSTGLHNSAATSSAPAASGVRLKYLRPFRRRRCMPGARKRSDGARQRAPVHPGARAEHRLRQKGDFAGTARATVQTPFLAFK